MDTTITKAPAMKTSEKAYIREEKAYARGYHDALDAIERDMSYRRSYVTKAK